MSYRNSIFSSVLLSFIFGLVACGGGGGGGGGLPSKPVDTKSATISGYAHLGPIQDGDISIYTFTNGIRSTSAIATATTDSQGFFQASVTSGSVPILICVKSGFYLEDKDNVQIDFIQQDDEICAVSNFVSEKPMQVSLTFYTHVAYGLAINLISNELSADQAITQANETISLWVGSYLNTLNPSVNFDIVSVTPKNIRDPSNNSGSLSTGVAYGFMNAAVSSYTEAASRAAAINGETNLRLGIHSLKFAKLAFEDIKDDGILDGSGKNAQGIIESLYLGASVLITANDYRNSLAVHMLDLVERRQINKTGMTGADITLLAKAVNDSTVSIFQGNAPIVLTLDKPRITNIIPLSSIYFGIQNISATISETQKFVSSVKLEISPGPIVGSAILINDTLTNTRTHTLNYLMDTKQYNDGVYTLTFSAVNNIGIAAIPEVRTITINNSSTMTLNLSGLASNALVRGNVRLLADVVDNIGIKSITFSSPPSYNFTTNYVAGTGSIIQVVDINTAGGLFPDGLHTVTVVAQSNNPTISVTKTINFTVDNTNPLVQISNVAAGDYISGSKVISSRNPAAIQTTINGTVSDAGGLDYIDLVLAGKSLLPQLSRNVSANVALSFDTTTAPNTVPRYPDGPTVLQLAAVDLAGNQNQANVNVEIDNTIPTLTIEITNPGTNTFYDKIPIAGFSNDNYQSGGVTKNGSGVKDTKVFIDNNITPVKTFVGTAATKIGDWIEPVPEGQHTIKIVTTDNVGLETIVTRTNVGLDTIPPQVNVTAAVLAVSRCQLNISMTDPGYSIIGVSSGSGLGSYSLQYSNDPNASAWTLINNTAAPVPPPLSATMSSLIDLFPFSGGYNRLINIQVRDNSFCHLTVNNTCTHALNGNVELTYYTENFCVTKTATGGCTVTVTPVALNGIPILCPK